MDRNSNEMVVGGHETDESISLEEMKYLEWKSNVSDEENFQIVSSRKTKKTREKQEIKKRLQGGKWPSS
jgi:hypothetical protein